MEPRFFSITVRPRAKRSEVEKRPDGSYRVSVTAPPIEGRANEAVTRALADYFNIPQSSVRITRGLSGKKKWVEIR
ncbi:MAG: DUF167 domain-containing protein [Deltaproteobacteria bacterium]|nr:DUF167 domain-containing protein [Deltaproteobacteria bacterium]